MKRGGPKNIVASVSARLVQRTHDLNVEHQLTCVSGMSHLFRPASLRTLMVMYATAVVDGKVVRFKISPALARAHRANRGKTMTEREAVGFVEARRRARALRRARPYLESRP